MFTSHWSGDLIIVICIIYVFWQTLERNHFLKKIVTSLDHIENQMEISNHQSKEIKEAIGRHVDFSDIEFRDSRINLVNIVNELNQINRKMK